MLVLLSNIWIKLPFCSRILTIVSPPGYQGYHARLKHYFLGTKIWSMKA